jgi:hypothetical protein
MLLPMPFALGVMCVPWSETALLGFLEGQFEFLETGQLPGICRIGQYVCHQTDARRGRPDTCPYNLMESVLPIFLIELCIGALGMQDIGKLSS